MLDVTQQEFAIDHVKSLAALEQRRGKASRVIYALGVGRHRPDQPRDSEESSGYHPLGLVERRAAQCGECLQHDEFCIVRA